MRAAFLTCLLLYACATKTGFKADISKIRPWSSQLADPLPPPYLVDFEAGPRALTFVAMDHANEAESPSLKLLGGAMDSRRYAAVVLEGVPRSQGISPASLLEAASKDGANGYYKQGERSVAVKIAAKKSVPFVGGEPDDDLVKATVLAAGFTLEDLFCFYVLQSVPELRREGSLGRGNFETSYIRLAERLGTRLGFGPGHEPSLEFFHKWYQAKMGRPFRVRDIGPDMLAPVAGGEIFTQRISAVVGRMRNEHIVKVTEEMLNRYGRVLVVYAAPHFLMQQPALESMLGKPARIADHP